MFSRCQAIDLLCYLEDRLCVLSSFSINNCNKRPKEITFWEKKKTHHENGFEWARMLFGNSFEEVQVRVLFGLCYPGVDLH